MKELLNNPDCFVLGIRTYERKKRKESKILDEFLPEIIFPYNQSWERMTGS